MSFGVNIMTWDIFELKGVARTIQFYLFFLEYPTTIFGDAMKQQVEDRLKFYETGELPRKNVEVMGTAVEEVSENDILVFVRNIIF